MIGELIFSSHLESNNGAIIRLKKHAIVRFSNRNLIRMCNNIKLQMTKITFIYMYIKEYSRNILLKENKVGFIFIILRYMYEN